MPLVTSRPDVLRLYSGAAERGWVIPAFGTENLTTTEAILAGTLEYGRRVGMENLPVTIAITHSYSGRSQSGNYSHTGDHALGLRLFQADIKTLTSESSPFRSLQVMTHLDHGQHDTDRDILDGDLSDWSSVMFDASSLALADNIKATREYVQLRREDAVIEGACDEIAESGDATSLSSPETVETYMQETGVDFIVANLGTEHRAGEGSLRYRDDLAREIRERIGAKLCLHGTSSVSSAQLSGLFRDGICKVNLWTALERDSSPPLLEHLTRHAARAAGRDTAQRLFANGLLGSMADRDNAVALDFCTTRARQHFVFEEMKRMIISWLENWYRP